MFAELDGKGERLENRLDPHYLRIFANLDRGNIHYFGIQADDIEKVGPA
jgi:hypothetical protein